MTHRSVRRSAPALLAGAVLLAACSESALAPDCAEPAAAAGAFTVSGTLENRSGASIPEDARVLVAWGVSATSPDYTYVYGEGTVRPACNTFRVTFDAPPPAEALNLGKLGIGVIFLTTDRDIREGIAEDGPDPSRVLGAAGDFAVIYRAPDAGETLEWARDFPAGYGVGRGVERPGSFDAFTPTSPSVVELVVDALENIEFVNWT